MAQYIGRVSPIILVVDDEPELRELLAEYLGRHGFHMRTAANAMQARLMVAQESPDLSLLDVNMPGENGLSLARWMRETQPGMGLVMLTTVSDAVDRVVGLEVGADDYVPKPFEMRELLARVRAVLRRTTLAHWPSSENGALAEASAMAGPTAFHTGPGALTEVPTEVPTGAPPAAAASAANTARFGDCELDLDRHMLRAADGSEIEITAAEFDLLALFARNPNRSLTRDEIMEQAHNRNWDVFDRSIDLRIMRLRRKIERNPDKPDVIKTVRGVGYVFVPVRP